MTTEKMTVELIEEAESAPEPGSFNRQQVINSPSDAFPIDVQISSLESAGYVYVYDNITGDRSVVNRNMLEAQLSKLRPDGTRFFTTAKPNFEPKQGELKCLLHEDDPERWQYDEWGFAVCNKSNLTSEFQVNRHVQIRHRMEWQTIYEERERKDKEEDRNFQRQLLGLATQGGTQPQVQSQTQEVDKSIGYSSCECGEEYRNGYSAQHQRGKKHQRWEKKNGAQHS